MVVRSRLNVLGSTALAILALPCGMIFLCAIGGAQWWVLRRSVAHAGWWVLANAVAWPVGVAVSVVGMALLPDSTGALVMLVMGVICGLLMGAVVGAITGIALVRLLPERGMEGCLDDGLEGAARSCLEVESWK
jgi:VIT1/CCC1 family predicted Fe2+/Mn2+ transporter